jgi:hypothetical protein
MRGTAEVCLACGCRSPHHLPTCATLSVADRAAKIRARREAARALRADRAQRRAEEAGFEQVRLPFTSLDGARTWASVPHATVVDRGLWGPFGIDYLITSSGARLLSLVRLTSKRLDRWTVELSEEEFRASRAGAGIMGMRRTGTPTVLPAEAGEDK